ncbi:hypothetical protein Ocin01_16504 [Orchesella cincta]|uniref:Uncharacterized protein n=1 Tax=Orchesella cincta TaxID=48709 RepID=A0A1D2MB10_ORCCI|nr:hypothetical protein Ocin01_16504 [Orchesella cincta]
MHKRITRNHAFQEYKISRRPRALNRLKEPFIIAVIINFVDLLVSVLGCYVGPNETDLVLLIIWFGFLSMKSILDTAD